MGPIRYELCQKPIIDLVLWVTGLCVFPPLIEPMAFPLTVAGAKVSVPFSAPVDKSYQLQLGFEFSSTEARLKDQIVGTKYQTECDHDPATLTGRPEFGKPIPIRVVIRKEDDKEVAIDQQFLSLCSNGFINNTKWRGVGWVTLPRGKYIGEITNLIAQDELTNTKIFITLAPGASGK